MLLGPEKHPSGYTIYRVLDTDLWRYLSEIDLISRIRGTLPVDDVPLLAADEDRVVIGRHRAALWLRLLDVPAAALTGRTYTAPADLVLEVRDDQIRRNNRRWRLRIGADGTADCEPSTSDAELTMTVRELARIYLGAADLVRLTRAGLVTEHNSGAAQRFQVALNTALAPFTDDQF